MNGLTRALQRTAAPLGSRTVQVICSRLLQPTGRFRRRSLSLVVRLKELPWTTRTTNAPIAAVTA